MANPIIDADGLFNGMRLRQCSNEARLHWPYVFTASNGYGCLEIDYLRIVARAFRSFRPIPSEPELMGYIAEYVKNYLLFTWDFHGQMWGQWDTKSKFLPAYRTEADKKSPRPPKAAFFAWKSSYHNRNGGLDFEKRPYLTETTSFGKSFPKVSEKFSGQVEDELEVEVEELPLPPLASPNGSPPGYASDESFVPFLEAYTKTGKQLIEADLVKTHDHWRYLNFEQKLQATKGVMDRIAAGEWSDPRFVMKPQNYLRDAEYKRAVTVRARSPGSRWEETSAEAMRLVEEEQERRKLRENAK